MAAIIPRGADGMDDVLRAQREGVRADGLPRRNIPDLLPGIKQLLLAGRCIDGAVRTPADAWLRISGVDDGVGFDLRNIIPYDLEWHPAPPYLAVSQ